MESATVTRPDSVRKRPLELSNSSGDGLPTKFKPGSPSKSSIMDCTAQFVMEQKVHDVEEHFRRSLQSFTKQKTSPSSSGSFLPVTNTTIISPTTNSAARGINKKEENQPHQIVIAENNSRAVTTTSPQNVQFIMTSSPAHHASTNNTDHHVPVLSTLPPGAFPPSLFLNISTASDKSPEGGAQLLTAGPALATTTVGGTGGTRKPPANTVMVPTFQSMIPTIATPNLIPVLDNTATPQLIPSTSTTPISGTSPVFYMGPTGSIPMLTQSGLVFMSPTDISRPPQLSVATPPSHNSSNVIPNYIILPQTFATNAAGGGGANFNLTLDQLTSLNNFQAQQKIQLQQQNNKQILHENKQQRVNIDLTTSDDRSSINSDEDLPRPPPLVAPPDSVEEHFARALGEQWKQLQQNTTPQSSLNLSDHNKITA